MNPDLDQIFQFIIELDKLKAVRRRIHTREDRPENSAEHSWHVALLALTLAPYATDPIEIDEAVKMLLLHDIVEIDTGDKFVYSSDHDDFENELAAAKRLFGLLPESPGETFLSLWVAFETSDAPTAVFARAMDRLMPVLLNLFNDGQSWVAHGISLAEVLEKNAVIQRAVPAVWSNIAPRLDAAKSKGQLR
jgi:putative hydrolases of HD superfamily